LQEGPCTRSGLTAITAANKIMAGPAKRRIRGEGLIAVFDPLSRRGLLKIGPPSEAMSASRSHHVKCARAFSMGRTIPVSRSLFIGLVLEYRAREDRRTRAVLESAGGAEICATAGTQYLSEEIREMEIESIWCKHARAGLLLTLTPRTDAWRDWGIRANPEKVCPLGR
jgi:hypothetical protein